MELTTLKSPKRIEVISREKLKKKPSQEPSTPKQPLKVTGHFGDSAVSFVQRLFLCAYLSSVFAHFASGYFLLAFEKMSF